MKGFRKFLMRGNLIDLAVAVVVGVAFNNIVQALIKDLITPLIAAVAGPGKVVPSTSTSGSGTTSTSASSQGGGVFSQYYILVHGQKFMWGDLVNAAISFLVIAAVVYFLLVAPSQKLAAMAARNQAATDRDCPECLSKIPIAAKRCMYCTSEVPPAPAATPPADNPVFPALRLGRHRAAAPDSPGPAADAQ